MPKDDKPPYFPFYVDDFSSDGIVEAMTTKEVGAYILLLCKSWRECPPGSIPDDDRVLSRWSRLTPDDWTECKIGVLAAFSLGTDNRWHQKRMRKEYQKLTEFKRQQAVSGRNGALKRWGRHSDPNGEPIKSPLAEHSLSPSLSPSPSQNDRERGTGHSPKAPSLEEVKTWASMSGVTEVDAEEFFHHFEASGWIDKHGNAIVNPRSKLMTWAKNARAKPAEQKHRAAEGKSGGGVQSPTTVASLRMQAEAIEAEIKSMLTERYVNLEWIKVPKTGKEADVKVLRDKMREIQRKIASA